MGSVFCSGGGEGSIDLTGDDSGYPDVRGIVQVVYNRRRGLVCKDAFWDEDDGRVACEELGHGDDVVITELDS